MGETRMRPVAVERRCERPGVGPSGAAA